MEPKGPSEEMRRFGEICIAEVRARLDWISDAVRQYAEREGVELKRGDKNEAENAGRAGRGAEQAGADDTGA